MIARLRVADGRIVESGFLPLHIGRDAVPRVLPATDARHREVADYVRAVSAEAGLEVRLRNAGDHVVIEGEAP